VGRAYFFRGNKSLFFSGLVRLISLPLAMTERAPSFLASWIRLNWLSWSPGKVGIWRRSLSSSMRTHNQSAAANFSWAIRVLILA
jgi:hypothetical protein